MALSTKPQCCFCRLPKSELECGLCHEPLCRSCVERLSEDAFELLREVPENLRHHAYCPRCHDEVVAPAAANYDEILERAKQVGYWARAYRGHVPVLKKAREKVQVISGGRDRDHVLLTLGFRAAELGYNGLIDGELKSRKVRDHGYQKMEWSGHAVPCKVDNEKLERNEFHEAYWRVLPHR